MDNKALGDLLVDMGYEGSLMFESPSYESAVVGVSDTGQVCYSYTKMVEHLIEADGMEYDEAVEFIDYNTVRALPYCKPQDKRPIIIYDLM